MATHILDSGFSDKRVFVVGINNPNLAGKFTRPNTLCSEQYTDGPTYIVVGPKLSDAEMLAAVPTTSSKRYGVTVEQLQAVRDNQQLVMEVAHV